MKYVPLYNHETIVDFFDGSELSPACWKILIGVVVEREDRSVYSEEDFSSASILSFKSQ